MPRFGAASCARCGSAGACSSRKQSSSAYWTEASRQVRSVSAVEQVELRLICAKLNDKAARRGWPRARLDEERADLFAELYGEPEGGPNALPPIELVPAGNGAYLIADGWHRVHGAVRAGVTELPACVLAVQPGQDPLTFAYDRALETSATSDKPLTNGEKRAAVERLIDERPQWSSREIAALTGTSHTFVNKLRRGLETDSTARHSGTTHGRTASAGEMAKRLVSGLASMWERKGLFEGSGKRADAKMGHRLAVALRERHGDDAPAWARRFAEWSANALDELEAEAPAEEKAA